MPDHSLPDPTLPDHSLPPYRIPVWGWILLVLAVAMLVGLIAIVFRDHQRVTQVTLGPAGAPSALAAAPALTAHTPVTG